MAHKEQRDFCFRVKNIYPDFFKNKKVLDIGSLDVNGNNRELFEDCSYIGLDVGEGKNVDVISPGHLYDAPDKFFDVIISTEVFEHDMFYEKTITNIMRMLKDNGLFLFTCAAPGRPEHGTRRCGEECAPLLIQISEEWADYYKNLDPEDIKKISNFEQTFPDGVFELRTSDIDIPSDLYFYGIKGGSKYYYKGEPNVDVDDYTEDIFIIDAWIDTEEKENDLLRLIKKLKNFNIPILLCGHYPIKPQIQNMVDYYIFDKNNPLLFEKEFFKYDVNSGFWATTQNWRSESKYPFHHDYAIWETMRNGFNFANYLGKKRIHFFEYDNDPDIEQYKQGFLEESKHFDAVLYEYSLGSITDKSLGEYCATYIFSINTETALKTINKIKSKHEYFYNRPEGWQLERVFLSCLKSVTNNIFISKYIDNGGQLNTQAVWNRDGITRNDGIFRIFVVVDLNGNVYCEFMSGFHDKKADKDYLVEINYMDNNLFHEIKLDSYSAVKLGKYKKGNRVKVYHKGVEILNEFLFLDFNEFYNQNKIIFNENRIMPKKLNINFIDGAFVEILDDLKNEYMIEFIDKKTSNVEYGLRILSNHWSKTYKKYFVDWRIKINSHENFKQIYDISLSNKNILISFESSSIGDTIAWIPYVEEFRKKHNCNLYCSTFHNQLFEDEYNKIIFIKPGTTVNKIYAKYCLGLMMKDGKYNDEYHPSDPKKLPLQQIATDILGLEFNEIRPKMSIPKKKTKEQVAIAIHSTAQTKYWNYPNGWQIITDYILSKGYEVILLSSEEDGYMGNKNPKGVIHKRFKTLKGVVNEINNSVLFIGLSSGLSWISWAVNTPTILISGFTDDFLEPKNGVDRVINKDVCHGCWSRHTFDPGDWNWCPDHKNTDRQFECTKQITPNSVIQHINKYI